MISFQNLSQQSDVADLLGGFKPMSAQFVCYPLYMEFENLFRYSVSVTVHILASYLILLNIVGHLNLLHLHFRQMMLCSIS